MAGFVIGQQTTCALCDGLLVTLAKEENPNE
jgi:hypothetical protein